MSLWPGSIWMMGCGNMGGALLRRWLETGLDASRVTVIDPAPQRIAGVAWQSSVPKGSPSLLILGVKPQIIAEAALLLKGHTGPDTMVLSMLAGTTLTALRGHFPEAGSITRCMPNLPASLGKGVTALFSDGGPQSAISALFAPTGLAEWLESESQFHAVVAVSGSGPAFVYRFIDALATSGTALGLPREQALRLAKAMVEGAAALSISSADEPVELARQVTSPGGTTAAGLAVLDEGNQFGKLIAATLDATAKRSIELGKV
jgi:pyrroline-5-carboxylate reductase